MTLRQSAAYLAPVLGPYGFLALSLLKRETVDGISVTSFLTVEKLSTDGTPVWYARVAALDGNGLPIGTDKLSASEQTTLQDYGVTLLAGVGDGSTDVAESKGFALALRRNLTAGEVAGISADWRSAPNS